NTNGMIRGVLCNGDKHYVPDFPLLILINNNDLYVNELRTFSSASINRS
ncbi:2892_t:CDS:1, partial [Dentiscutata erythropus]